MKITRALSLLSATFGLLLTAACAGQPGTVAPSGFTGTLAYTSRLQTLRIEADGRLSYFAPPAEDVTSLQLRSLALHPSKRWLLALARGGRPGGGPPSWDRVVSVPLDSAGLPDVLGRRVQALEPIPGEARDDRAAGSSALGGLLSAAFSPQGDLLYVARARFRDAQRDCHGPGALTAHAFDVASGTLGPPGPAATTPTDPIALLVDGSERVYAIGQGDTTQRFGPCGAGGVSVHAIQGAGRLTEGQTLEGDAVAFGGALGGARFFLSSLDFIGFRTAPTPTTRLLSWVRRPDGAFLPEAGIEFASWAGVPVAQPGGRFVYVTVDHQLHGYAVLDSGLVPVPGSPVAEHDDLGSLFLSPDGRYLYGHRWTAGGTGFQQGVYGYRLDPQDGGIERLPASPFLTDHEIPGWVFATFP